MSKSLPAVLKYYKMPKPDIFSRGVPSQLPDAYRKFYEEWNAPKSPVHYQPEAGKWKRDPLTGEVNPIQNVPLKLRFPKEFHTGIWGGEAVIFGYKKQRKYVQESTKWWVPNLIRTVVHSEILDKWLSVIITKRTIQLIFDHHGFDNYILETPTCDLYSLLALKLRKKMLLALFEGNLYPEDPIKQEKIYNKYKHHLDNCNIEDLDWYALSIGEAVAKLQKMEDEVQPVPLKHQFRTGLINELKALAATGEFETKESSGAQSWLKKINPFITKEEATKVV